MQDSAKSEASNRVIPLTPYAVRLLEGLSQGRRGEWVFTDAEGDRLSYEALRYQTQGACRSAGVDYKGEHVFRHTFATNCYYKGVDIKFYPNCWDTPTSTSHTTFTYIYTVMGSMKCTLLL